MKLILCTWSTIILCLLASCSPNKGLHPSPLDVKFGDPYVLLASDGHYYMYGTGGVKNGFGCYKSDDLKNWEYLGAVYQGNTPESWAKANFWAPEVYEKDGRFYMFFSADWKENPNNERENFHIGVAVSDSPAGPFKEISDKPLFSPGYPAIDGNVLFDKDGRCYLYFSRCCYKHPVESEIAAKAKADGMYDEIEESWIYGAELLPDFSGIVGEPVRLLAPPTLLSDVQAEWESRSVTRGEAPRRWTEGSYIFRHNGKYYMMYSANAFFGGNYAVGYATSDSPLGPFEKSATNPVLSENASRGGDVVGTGHNMVLTLPSGQMYTVYHGRIASSPEDRVVFIDPIEIDSAGVLTVDGPTTAPRSITL